LSRLSEESYITSLRLPDSPPAYNHPAESCKDLAKLSETAESSFYCQVGQLKIQRVS
jgi:hypothetical protein